MRLLLLVMILFAGHAEAAPAPWLVNPSKLQTGRKVWVDFSDPNYRYRAVLISKTPAGWLLRLEGTQGQVRWEQDNKITLRR